MPCSRSFVDHALDLLSLLGPVQERRLFGGAGVYARGVMFALLDDDELFLKTDAESLPRFRERDCRMWVWASDGPDTDYYRPPDEAHEDAESMLPWARLGLDAALRKHAAKAAKAAASAARRAERERKAAGGKARPRETAKAKVKAKVGAQRRPAARKGPKRAPRRKAPSRGRVPPR